MSGLVVDLFAGGGGASTGIEAALGRPVDIAEFCSRIRVAESGCWEWTGSRGKRPDGSVSYGTFSMKRGRRTRNVLAHRLAWMLVHGAISDGQVVCHRCDNVLCVRPDHLFLGTQAQNLADMRAKGRGAVPSLKGERHPQAKLDETTVRSIRRLRAKGLTFAAIGERFGITAGTCHAITSGRLWSHVQ